ncbi:DinB family protein [Paenibacillus lautus]|uniref:DinB family protein n=2 Tax=Paenibacillus TaxID=44249 RepID=UPI001E559DE3|nr:DinB family protein [Paenibacillus lautus]
MPTGILSYDETMDKLNRVRETTKQIITKLDERNTNDLHDPHPYGFELNAEQWAHFIAIHETLHIRQLGRIREANQ